MVTLTIISTTLAIAGIVAKFATTTAVGGSIINAMSIDNVSKIQGFDQPMQDTVQVALNMVGTLLAFVQNLITVFAFLFIVISAIKMMFGAVELKKFFVDAIFKCIIVVILVAIFPAIMTKTFSLATKLGLEITGGQEQISLAFTNTAKKSKELWEKGSQTYFNLLKGQYKMNADGTYSVDDRLMEVFLETGMSESEVREFAARENIKFVSNKGTFFYDSGETYKVSEIKESYKVQRSPTGDKEMKRAVSIINGMREILTGVTSDGLIDGTATDPTGKPLIDVNDIMNMGENELDAIFFNPFMEGQDDMLSASAMIKTAIVLSEMLSAGYMAEYDDSAKEEKLKVADFVKDNTTFLKWLGTIIKNFVFKVGLILAMIIIMIEYTLTVIEFFLVMAMSILLIPMFFLDATKSFATNILRTVISYFFKILVTVTMVFFVMGMYITTFTDMVPRDSSTPIVIFYYIYVLMLGLVLVKSAGRIAGSVVSGNPSLDFGAMAHQMHGMSHAVRSGSRMAGQYLNEGKQALQKSGTQVLDAASTLKGMNAAKMAAQQTAAGLEGTSLTDKQIASVGNQAARQFQAQKLAQNFKDGMFERLTGQKADAPNEGLMKVGRTYMGANGDQQFASNARVKDNSNDLASGMGRDKMQPYVDQAKNHGETTTNMNKTDSGSAGGNNSGDEEKTTPKKNKDDLKQTRGC